MIGQELTARRRALNLTPQQLAERLGVTAAVHQQQERVALDAAGSFKK